MSNSTKPEFVYVLSNSALKGLYKIGFSNNVERRRKELSRATGVPRPFKIELIREFKNAKKVEGIAHKYFGGTQNDKEFFEAPLYEIIKFIDDVYIKEQEELKNNIVSIYIKKARELKDFRISKLQLETYKEYNHLITNPENLQKWWSKLNTTFKIQILKRKANRIGTYLTYLNKQELIFAIEQVLQYSFLPNDLFETSPYQQDINEGNVNTFAKAIFPILKAEYPDWYQKITGKNLIENLPINQLKGILFLKEISISKKYDTFWTDLNKLINLNIISIGFEIDRDDIEFLRLFPHLETLIIHKIKPNSLETLSKINHIKKITFKVSLSKKQIDEETEDKIVKYFPNHTYYGYCENLKFGRKLLKMYFEK